MEKIGLVKLFVKPKSSTTFVEGKSGDRIIIKVASLPEKGKANKKLIEFLSFKLGLPKGNISIISGHKSNFKTVSARGITSEELILKLLS